LIPFDISFVASPTKPNERKIDLELPDKLKNESSGILLWLLEGCLKWQKQGLNPPETVLAATKEYQAEEDFIGNFINENCEVAPDIKVQAGKLYGVYKDWCDEYGHEPISGKAFGIDIKSRFDSYTKKYVFYKGVGLKNDH